MGMLAATNPVDNSPEEIGERAKEYGLRCSVRRTGIHRRAAVPVRFDRTLLSSLTTGQRIRVLAVGNVVKHLRADGRASEA